MDELDDIDKFPFDVIISHGPCVDGVTAAWVLWRILPEKYKNKLARKGGSYSLNGDEQSEEEKNNLEGPLYPVNSLLGAEKLQRDGYPIVFAFAHPNEEIPLGLIKGKKVLFMDIDPSNQLPLLINNCSFLTIIDHHDSTINTLKLHNDLIKSNKDKININVETYNKKKSAANMIWELINENEETPDMVEIVRIGDTWDFDDRPDLKPRNVLKALKMDKVFKSFKKIEETYLNWNDKFAKYKEIGTIVNKYENNLITKAAKKVALCYMKTKDGTYYNVAYTAANILHSEIGASLRFYAEERFYPTKIDFCATWKYVPHEEVIIVSLRSPATKKEQSQSDNQETINLQSKSRDDREIKNYIDLSEIARNIEGTDGKGGGHYDASSFTFKEIEKFHYYFKKSKDGYKGKNYNPGFKPATIPASTLVSAPITQNIARNYINPYTPPYNPYLGVFQHNSVPYTPISSQYKNMSQKYEIKK